MRLACLLALIALAACASDPAPGVTTDTAPAGSNPAASTDSIPESALRGDSAMVDYEQAVRLVSVQNGDRACYLTVQADGEPERTELADFRFCERTDLVGRRVVLTVTPSEIMAESCQGDPACTDTEPVNLVTGIDPAEGGAPADTTEG